MPGCAVTGPEADLRRYPLEWILDTEPLRKLLGPPLAVKNLDMFGNLQINKIELEKERRSALSGHCSVFLFQKREVLVELCTIHYAEQLVLLL